VLYEAFRRSDRESQNLRGSVLKDLLARARSNQLLERAFTKSVKSSDFRVFGAVEIERFRRLSTEQFGVSADVRD
jgi:hypothetical protein